ncbi:Uncharacterized protein DBV15_08421 [Temnothorax longispinosus]|uniref:Uncharacterized protein n=1 Tax=Temnothorax longispinosus TaxID=300112 RepID=A0A4S2L199_9HYME|nr:Uncharacterized protein DBV15_08421 [Temnothorax longispinosus]
MSERGDPEGFRPRDGEKPKAVENGRGSSMGWLIACEQARFFLRLSFLAFPPSVIFPSTAGVYVALYLRTLHDAGPRMHRYSQPSFTDPPPLSFGNNYRAFPLRLTLRHNTGTHHFVP